MKDYFTRTDEVLLYDNEESDESLLNDENNKDENNENTDPEANMLVSFTASESNASIVVEVKKDKLDENKQKMRLFLVFMGGILFLMFITIMAVGGPKTLSKDLYTLQSKLVTSEKVEAITSEEKSNNLNSDFYINTNLDRLEMLVDKGSEDLKIVANTIHKYWYVSKYEDGVLELVDEDKTIIFKSEENAIRKALDTTKEYRERAEELQGLINATYMNLMKAIAGRGDMTDVANIVEKVYNSYNELFDIVNYPTEDYNQWYENYGQRDYKLIEDYYDLKELVNSNKQ